jgi:hypothetical protein
MRGPAYEPSPQVKPVSRPPFELKFLRTNPHPIDSRRVDDFIRRILLDDMQGARQDLIEHP